MELSQSSRKLLLTAAPAAVATALVVLGLNWQHAAAGQTVRAFPLDSLLPLLKLMSAGAIGYLITAVQKQAVSERPLSRPMEQAQIILCIAGAMVVMLIGESLARAVGILGGAAIVRFRTPVDDPKDATILFVILGLGMAAGLGYFGIAGTGALFLCAILLSFKGEKQQKLRVLSLQVVGSWPEAPTGLIESVLSRHNAAHEPREISRGERASIRYQVSVDDSVSLAAVSRELLEDSSAGVQSVSWDSAKKERYQ